MLGFECFFLVPLGLGIQPHFLSLVHQGGNTTLLSVICPLGVGIQPLGVGIQPLGVGIQPLGVGAQP